MSITVFRLNKIIFICCVKTKKHNYILWWHEKKTSNFWKSIDNFKHFTFRSLALSHVGTLYTVYCIVYTHEKKINCKYLIDYNKNSDTKIDGICTIVNHMVISFKNSNRPKIIAKTLFRRWKRSLHNFFYSWFRSQKKHSRNLKTLIVSLPH